MMILSICSKATKVIVKGHKYTRYSRSKVRFVLGLLKLYYYYYYYYLEVLLLQLQ